MIIRISKKERGGGGGDYPVVESKRSVDRAEFGEEISEDEVLRIFRLEQRLSWSIRVCLPLRGKGELVDLNVLSWAVVETTYV